MLDTSLGIRGRSCASFGIPDSPLRLYTTCLSICYARLKIRAIHNQVPSQRKFFRPHKTSQGNTAQNSAVSVVFFHAAFVTVQCITVTAHCLLFHVLLLCSPHVLGGCQCLQLQQLNQPGQVFVTLQYSTVTVLYSIVSTPSCCSCAAFMSSGEVTAPSFQQLKQPGQVNPTGPSLWLLSIPEVSISTF